MVETSDQTSTDPVGRVHQHTLRPGEPHVALYLHAGVEFVRIAARDLTLLIDRPVTEYDRSGLRGTDADRSAHQYRADAGGLRLCERYRAWVEAGRPDERVQR